MRPQVAKAPLSQRSKHIDANSQRHAAGKLLQGLPNRDCLTGIIIPVRKSL